MMTGSHPAVLNAVISVDSPKVCVLKNPTYEVIKITRNIRLATAHEITDSVYFVADVASAL